MHRLTRRGLLLAGLFAAALLPGSAAATEADSATARLKAETAIQKSRDLREAAIKNASPTLAGDRHAERAALRQQRLLDMAGRELEYASARLEAGDTAHAQHHAALASKLVTSATTDRRERGGR